ncbi:MAG TPA: adenylate/guanylate cyclase domain-containing protein [Terracidiphilus sp.]|nr:adenylate/guanylate cyclase domain-containing protein [Terracidiphilus sp.]
MLRKVTVRAYAQWSIRYKLMASLLLLSVTTVAVTGTIAYIKNLNAVKTDVTNQLTGVTRSKRAQIEAYYRTIHSHVETLSDDRMIVDAMRSFRDAYRKMNKLPVKPSMRDAVREDYQEKFFPEMQRLNMARQSFQAYMPVIPAAIHLQYLYIVKNPFPKDQRDQLVNPGDGSEYSRVHQKFQLAFRDIVRKFGYYDLYLIDFETGNQVYDVAKDRDFATSLTVGPYAGSNLARVVRQCILSSDPNAVFFSDFEPYEASRGEPTQYVASTIWDGKERIGILAFQLSTDAINKVMTGDRGWENDGLGKTGEALLVGPSHLPRSDVRAYLEDPEGYLARQKAAGVPEETLNRIRTFKTTILQTPITGSAVDLALNGEEGTHVRLSGRGIAPELVSYTPVQIEGLHWALIARKDANEAYRPLKQMQWVFSGWGLCMLLLTVLAAWFMTNQILRPVNALVDAAEKVSAGDLTAHVDWKNKDELGLLSHTFNAMTRSIREKNELIEQKNRENERLLLNILPGEVAARLKHGEHEIADSFADVTVLFGDIVGFTALSSRTSAPEIVEMLNGLFSQFDSLAQELGIEKIKTIGDCYMAVCGLPRTCSDHAQRMARMALRMTEVTAQYGQTLGINLQLRIGLNSGPVVAGVIGTIKFIYDLWGDTVNLASRMESTSMPGAIQVTRAVYDQLRDSFEFESRGLVQVKGKGEIETWLLLGELSRIKVPQ